jgi:hypothetical protein
MLPVMVMVEAPVLQSQGAVAAAAGDVAGD